MCDLPLFLWTVLSVRSPALLTKCCLTKLLKPTYDVSVSRLRRYHTKGNIYFITCVTFQRQPLLLSNIDLLTESARSLAGRVEFDMIAWVVLPDHFHAVIDPKNEDISRLMQRFKMSFAALYRKREVTKSGRIWQHRFWDHIIRNENDMNRHINYIHYNPMKHGLAAAPVRWEFSTFRRYVRDGYYNEDWGVHEVKILQGEYGE